MFGKWVTGIATIDFRRKRGEREVTETPGDVIVRKLTIERIEELKRIVQDEQVKYR